MSASARRSRGQAKRSRAASGESHSKPIVLRRRAGSGRPGPRTPRRPAPAPPRPPDADKKARPGSSCRAGAASVQSPPPAPGLPHRPAARPARYDRARFPRSRGSGRPAPAAAPDTPASPRSRAARTRPPAKSGPRSRAPLGKGRQQRDSGQLGLLGMELGPHDGALADQSGKGPAVVAGSEHVASPAAKWDGSCERDRRTGPSSPRRGPRADGAGPIRSDRPGPNPRGEPVTQSRTAGPGPEATPGRGPREPPRSSRRRAEDPGRCPSPAGRPGLPRAPRRPTRWRRGSATPGRSFPLRGPAPARPGGPRPGLR